MTTMKEFTNSKPRPLPVIILADISGSMKDDGKIEALNQSMRQMMESFSNSADLRAEIHVAVVTFGGTAQLHTPLAPASTVTWRQMAADGGTPMGAAMKIAAELIEDQQQIPSRAYRPAVLLISDGHPTDSKDQWEVGFDSLVRQGRAQKADRMALAIGADADEEMLKRYLNDPEKKVFHAEDAGKISNFFRFFTMSVTSRSHSTNPNEVPQMTDPFALGDL